MKHVVEIGLNIKTFDENSSLGRDPQMPMGPMVSVKQVNFMGTGRSIQSALESAFNAALEFAHSTGATAIPEEVPEVATAQDLRLPKRLQ